MICEGRTDSMQYQYWKVNFLYVLVQYFLFLLFPYQTQYEMHQYLSLQDRFTDAVWYLFFLKFSYLILFYTVVIFLVPVYLYVIQFLTYKWIYLKNPVKAVYFLILSLLSVDVLRWLIMNLIRHY